MEENKRECVRSKWRRAESAEGDGPWKLLLVQSGYRTPALACQANTCQAHVVTKGEQYHG